MADVAQRQPDSVSEGWFDGVLRGFYALRVSLFMGALTVAALTVPDQVREIHRILTQERTGSLANFFNLHWVLAVLSLIALAVVLWQTARKHAEDGEADAGLFTSANTSAAWVLTWGPRFIAMLPLLGAALGIWISRSTVFSLDNIEPADIPVPLQSVLKQQADLSVEFAKGTILCLVLAVVVFIAATYFERRLAPVGSQRVRRLAIINNWLLFPIIILASIVFLVFYPVRLPQLVGSIPIFALWMANLAVLFALFWRYSRLVGFPIIAILVALLIVFEASGRTDNHEFRHDPPDPAKPLARPSVEAAFRTWLGSRADLDAYKTANKPYPVYIVAAEGGGLYAAYQTAKLLGRMQDLCRNFSQHLFLVSAVSGGSLGSAVFAGLTREYAKNEPAQGCVPVPSQPGKVETAAHDILSRDLLSPVMWATLFPDFLQRFIPHPFPMLDRGLALDVAFEDTWRTRNGPKENYLAGSFFNLCGDGAAACAKGATPALALNMTNVETGMQMVLSHMELNTWPLDNPPPRLFDVFNSGVDPVDMKLSTAVGLSARFPWLSPQGWFTFTTPEEKAELGEKKATRRMSFVDGGYVDNSGVATATKIARLLAYVTASDPTLPKVEIKIIVISAAWIPFERFFIDAPQNTSTSEYVSPFVAAIAAWQGRGYTAQADVSVDKLFNVIDMGVYYNFMPLPVGWHLSTLSRNYIDKFKGDPASCDEDKAKPSLKNHATMAGSYIYKANCAAAKIVRDLSPGK